MHMSKVCNAWLLIFELMYLIENSLREITLNMLRYATEEHRFSTIEDLLIKKWAWCMSSHTSLPKWINEYVWQKHNIKINRWTTMIKEEEDFFKRWYLIFYVHISKVCNACLFSFELMFFNRRFIARNYLK